MVSCSYGSYTDSFRYGADGLRRQMTSNGTTDNYAYDGQSMIREMNSALTPQATYLTGMRGPEYRRNDTQTESDGQGHTFGLTRWYVYDGLGSVVGEVDPLGNLTCSDEYDVYGAVRGRTGTASTAHGFVGGLGHLSDASTGMIYMRARYYDPSTGRFASEDPGRHGNNWFAYCDDNPVRFVDDSGKDIDDSVFNGIAKILWQLFSHATGIGAPGFDPSRGLMTNLRALQAAAQSVMPGAQSRIGAGAVEAESGEAADDPTDAMATEGSTTAGEGLAEEAVASIVSEETEELEQMVSDYVSEGNPNFQ